MAKKLSPGENQSLRNRAVPLLSLVCWGLGQISFEQRFLQLRWVEDGVYKELQERGTSLQMSRELDTTWLSPPCNRKKKETIRRCGQFALWVTKCSIFRKRPVFFKEILHLLDTALYIRSLSFVNYIFTSTMFSLIFLSTRPVIY